MANCVGGDRCRHRSGVHGEPERQPHRVHERPGSDDSHASAQRETPGGMSRCLHPSRQDNNVCTATGCKSRLRFGSIRFRVKRSACGLERSSRIAGTFPCAAWSKASRMIWSRRHLVCRDARRRAEESRPLASRSSVGRSSMSRATMNLRVLAARARAGRRLPACGGSRAAQAACRRREWRPGPRPPSSLDGRPGPGVPTGRGHGRPCAASDSS
jgi:hypothetical protein